VVVVGAAEPINTDPLRLICGLAELPLMPPTERLTTWTVTDEIGSDRGVGAVRA
jgi:hypothetical protein